MIVAAVLALAQFVVNGHGRPPDRPVRRVGVVVVCARAQSQLRQAEDRDVRDESYAVVLCELPAAGRP
jgi:hypothetical protein